MLAAAQRTRHYEQYRWDVRHTAISNAADCLKRIEPVSLIDYLKHAERFRDNKAWSFSWSRFHHSIPGVSRTAILSPHFLPGLHSRVFSNPWDPALARYEPEMIAGPIDTLRCFAEAVRRGATWIPPLRHSVIAFTGILEGPLRADDRELLWQAFGVPVYEQFFGFGGDLLAAECDAHAGLHLSRDAGYLERLPSGEILVTFLDNPHFPVLRLESGMLAEWHEAPCECGSVEPRLVNLRRKAASRVRESVLAASM